MRIVVGNTNSNIMQSAFDVFACEFSFEEQLLASNRANKVLHGSDSASWAWLQCRDLVWTITE